MARKILIIDDEEKLRTLLARIIGLEGFEVLQAADGKSALKQLAQAAIDVVLCDVKLPDTSGVTLVKTIKEQFPAVELILLTAYGNIPDGVQAIKNGAFDYLTKGDDNNRIVPLLHQAIAKADRNKSLLQQRETGKPAFGAIIGQSKPILQAIELARKVAKADTATLLTGETGTGKEVFAQAIHRESSRSAENFVAINCAAFSKDLLESEMFGHKAGAFTGALKDQKGLFEAAHLGTIFLDEIGEMALELQAKLLRVIESGEFIKVGETKATKVNVRIIAATNRDLKAEVLQGTFREDLFYRVSVFQVELPALRERVPDIPLLAEHFIKHFALPLGTAAKAIHPDCQHALIQYAWPGNIRELKNVIERAMILSEGEQLLLEDLPVALQVNATAQAGKPLSAFSLQSVERLHILKILRHTGGNKAEAARLLEIGIATLYRKLEEYKI